MHLFIFETGLLTVQANLKFTVVEDDLDLLILQRPSPQVGITDVCHPGVSTELA